MGHSFYDPGHICNPALRLPIDLTNKRNERSFATFVLDSGRAAYGDDLSLAKAGGQSVLAGLRLVTAFLESGCSAICRFDTADLISLAFRRLDCSPDKPVDNLRWH
jgi:hypothetical protein